MAGTFEVESLASGFGEDVHSYWVEFSLLQCNTCHRPVVEECMWVDSRDGIPDMGETLYPKSGARHHSKLPLSVREPYEKAKRLKPIDPESFVVKLGRVLEAVCADRGASGSRLVDRIDALAESGEIPERLARMAHRVRVVRNYGAHHNLGEVDLALAGTIEQFVDMILEYVYWAPAMLESLSESIRES